MINEVFSQNELIKKLVRMAASHDEREASLVALKAQFSSLSIEIIRAIRGQFELFGASSPLPLRFPPTQ